VNYVYTPGVAVNVLDFASSAALQITGDLDLRVDVALDNYNSTDSQNILLGKVTTSGTVKEYVFQYEYSTLSGQLALVWRESGGTTRTARATASTSTITNGTRRTLRATLDVDNGAGQYEVKFFSSTDNITWTQIGATVTGATGVTNVGTGNGNVSIAATPSTTGGTFPTSGKFYRAQILNGIDGVPVLDVDTSVISTGAATSFTALTGQTVTINRSTSGRKTTVVTHPVWLFGTDDYMEVNNRWLGHTGSNYLYLPGVASNYASTPDSAALDITGDIDLRVKVAMDDWTPSAGQYIINKYTTGSNVSYAFNILTDGRLNFFWSPLGTSAGIISTSSSVTTGIADGTTKWVRATLDVDNGAGTPQYEVKFWLSDDGTNWTQLGTTVTGATGVTSLHSGTAPLEIGSVLNGTSNPARGKFFRAQVLNGIGGTTVFDANFETGITSNLPTTFTESSANAATVTINYSGTGYRSAGVIASTYVYPGATNTFKLSATDLLSPTATDDFTVLFFGRPWATLTNFGRFISKTLGSSVLWAFMSNSTTANTWWSINSGAGDPSNQGTGNNTSIPFTLGNASLLGFRIDRTAADIRAIVNSTISSGISTTSVGSLSNTASLRVGVDNVTNYQNFEFISAVVFRRALTSTEITTLNSYFQGRAS
jgi:hypothetical protein